MDEGLRKEVFEEIKKAKAHYAALQGLLGSKNKEERHMHKFRDFARFDKNPFRRFVERLIARFLDRYLEPWLDQWDGYFSRTAGRELRDRIDALYRSTGYELEYKPATPGSYVAFKAKARMETKEKP